MNKERELPDKEFRQQMGQYDHTGPNSRPRSIRVDQQLWDAFDFWCTRNNTTRTQELNAYMEYYVTREQLAGGYQLNPEVQNAIESLIDDIVESRLAKHMSALFELTVNKNELEQKLKKQKRELERRKKQKAELEGELDDWEDEPVSEPIPEDEDEVDAVLRDSLIKRMESQREEEEESDE